jgi:dienelactone hydrolase
MKYLMGVLLVTLSFSANTYAKILDYVFNPEDPHHTLYKPEGAGPFPALLLLHASTGVVDVNHDWARKLKDRGFVVYIIDSFKPRGWKDRESIGWEKATAAQLDDVIPAYRYLSQLPYVDSQHIGLLGFSMGGFDVLKVMEKSENPAEYQKLPFQVAASFYGVCHRLSPSSELRGPTQIFVGANDDRATTEDCIKLVERSQKRGKAQINISIYADALHGFDNYDFPANKEVVDERGEHYHIGYNASARQQAISDLPPFLDKYLKK